MMYEMRISSSEGEDSRSEQHKTLECTEAHKGHCSIQSAPRLQHLKNNCCIQNKPVAFKTGLLFEEKPTAAFETRGALRLWPTRGSSWFDGLTERLSNGPLCQINTPIFYKNLLT